MLSSSQERSEMKTLVAFFLAISLVIAVKGTPPEEGYDFEGDIVLTPRQKTLIEQGRDLDEKDSWGRAASSTGLWPNGVFPYVIHSSLANRPEAMRGINGAIKEWSQKTCIKFVKRTTERDYVMFTEGMGWGCNSIVGRYGKKQDINLAEGCWGHGTIVHEIGHALGFWHEQSRPDRDQYVTIMWDNIKEQSKHNFKKYTSSVINSLGVPYDYGSIMHYHSMSFSKNFKPTIVPKQSGVEIGQRNGLSQLDARQMNLLYKCGSGGGGGGGGPRPPPATRPPPMTRPTRPPPATRPPRPTRPPVTSSPGCTDKFVNCAKYAHLCTSNQAIKKHCRVTCNLCGGGGGGGGPPTFRPPTQAPSCKDNSPRCSKYVKYCNSSDYMKRNCRRTCNHC